MMMKFTPLLISIFLNRFNRFDERVSALYAFISKRFNFKKYKEFVKKYANIISMVLQTKGSFLESLIISGKMESKTL